MQDNMNDMFLIINIVTNGLQVTSLYDLSTKGNLFIKSNLQSAMKYNIKISLVLKKNHASRIYSITRDSKTHI